MAKRESDALLSGAGQVAGRVTQEVEAEPLGTDAAVTQHALGTVAEGQHAQPFAAGGNGGGQGVEFRIRKIGPEGAAQPGVEDAGAVDAEQHADARVGRGVVDVSKTVDPTLRIVGQTVGDPVDHARSATGGGDFAGVEDVEREGVVGLVAGAVGHRDAGGQAEFGGDRGEHPGLFAKSGRKRGQQRRVQSPVFEEEFGRGVFRKIPERALGQAGGGRLDFAGQAQREVIARQHDLADTAEVLRLVLLNPAQLRGGEIPRGVEQAAEAGVGAEFSEGLGADFHRTAVAPDDGGAHRLVALIEGDQAVHLVRDTDGGDLGNVLAGAGGADGKGGVLPPLGRILLGPTRARRGDRHLLLRRLGGGDDAARGGIKK